MSSSESFIVRDFDGDEWESFRFDIEGEGGE